MPYTEGETAPAVMAAGGREAYGTANLTSRPEDYRVMPGCSSGEKIEQQGETEYKCNISHLLHNIFFSSKLIRFFVSHYNCMKDVAKM